MATGTPDPTEPIYRVRELRRVFGDLVVLDGLAFDLVPGECLAILGRSGTGKSVLLRQMNGLDKPNSGSILFHGQEIVALSEHELFPLRRRVAMLFQGGALFDSMTVYENVSFPLREHTDLAEAEIARRVHDELRRVGLRDIDEQMPASLSGGMKKRVALARSLILDPEVLLFDEPTSGLDPVTSATIGRLIRTVQTDLRVSAMVVTHDIALARRVGDRVAYLSGGRFRFLGTWEEAETSPDMEFRDFLAGREEASHAA